jgi:hypothetical protein
LVPLSGGKDSVYLIHKLKAEYGLRVLAHTTDIDIGPVARANIDRAVAKLDVEHVTYRPSMDFYRRLFRWLLMNQEARGAVHTDLVRLRITVRGNSLRLAMEYDIPLVLAGYSPGQAIAGADGNTNSRAQRSPGSTGLRLSSRLRGSSMKRTSAVSGTRSVIPLARHSPAIWRRITRGPTTRTKS